MPQTNGNISRGSNCHFHFAFLFSGGGDGVKGGGGGSAIKGKNLIPSGVNSFL